MAGNNRRSAVTDTDPPGLPAHPWSVTAVCLAVSEGHVHGIWGGTTAKGRAAT